MLPLPLLPAAQCERLSVPLCWLLSKQRLLFLISPSHVVLISISCDSQRAYCWGPAVPVWFYPAHKARLRGSAAILLPLALLAWQQAGLRLLGGSGPEPAGCGGPFIC
jgi:hypothetical protein